MVHMVQYLHFWVQYFYLKYPGVAKCKEAYRKKFGGQDPPIYVSGPVDMVNLLKMAMEKAGTVTDTLKIREAWLKSVPPQDVTVVGTTGYTPEGETIYNINMGRFEKGKLVPIK